MVMGAQIYNILKMLSYTLKTVSLMLYELCHNKKIAKKTIKTDWLGVRAHYPK